ncbi:MAG: DUF87 domain-containing protein [Butyrivibrio sp.]|jgi:energy-coupling factor transporter ATP-binding protein EcfA2|nr:DUF87 domain-containing protein [Butyrivibrio sp.]
MRQDKWYRLRAGNLPLTRKGRIARKVEKFVKRNSLYQFHYVIENGAKVERVDYYPTIDYMERKVDNEFLLKIRMDGTMRSERFRDMEQELADMFKTVCIGKCEERGYLIYHFERTKQEQKRIYSHTDIQIAGETEIVFSGIAWDWRKCPHLLLVGNTGSGKTQTAQYIISCLLNQGARVIYCDPKNDDDMRLFMQVNPSVGYVTKENEIAKVVRETEEEVRLRERDLQNIGIDEAEFNPVFLFFDELIAFSKIAEKKTYDETQRRLASIVVTGRSKRIYVGLILQRPDTSFVEGAIRDNLSCRICMGQMSDAAYKMAFGSDFAHVKNNRHEIGAGLIFRQGVDTKPREFLTPYIEKGALNRK